MKELPLLEGKILEEFNNRVEKKENGCWDWIGSLNVASGQPIFYINRKAYLAHRVSYQNFLGTIEPFKHIYHTCRSRRCVNPKHLAQGTPEDSRKRR